MTRSRVAVCVGATWLSIALSTSAWAQPCLTCWDASCEQMKTYGLPACGGGKAPSKHEKKADDAPGGKKPDKAACAGGQEISGDTAGHCCWPGQVWEGKCRGVPTSCPTDLTVDAAGEACRPAACEKGLTRLKDGIHCCWPGQAWSGQRSKCVGVPHCPHGFRVEASAESCVLAECAADEIRPPGGTACERCRGADKVPDAERTACVLKCSRANVPNAARTRCEPCPEGKEPDAANEQCQCKSGLVRSQDGAECHACDEGLIADAAQAHCVPAPCAEGTARKPDGRHCSPCKEGYAPSSNREQCEPLPCRQEGHVRALDGACVLDPGLVKALAEKRLAAEREHARIAEEERRAAELERERQEKERRDALDRANATRAGRRRAGIGLLVAGVVVGGISGAFVGLGSAQNGRIRNSQFGDFATASDLQSEFDKGTAYNRGAIATGVIGGALAVTGVLLIVTALPLRADARVTLAPTSGGAAATLTVDLP